jgi:hypothetical protein
VLGLAIASAGSAPAAEPPGRLSSVQPRGLLVLPPELPGGRRLRETSGLAWDAGGRRWWTVGDRGLLVRWSMAFDGGRLQARPEAADVVAGKPNVESVDVLPGGGLVLLDETRGHVLRLDGAGQIVSSKPVAATPQADFSRGAEALVWHPHMGLLVVPQRPAKGAAPGHVVVGEAGQVWVVPASAGGKASVKAAHAMPSGRLLLLEKLVPASGAVRWLLREVDLAACGGERPCAAASVPVTADGLAADDNLEGLACSDDAHCLIVSDDGRLAAPRTLLIWVALQREAAR